jgi:hypothetical protein
VKPATLAVEVADDAIERTRVDLAVVFFFEAERPLRGDAGRADWRLCGRISRLIRADRINGCAGEALLTPSGGGLRAPWLLALGLGPRDRFDPDACRALGRDAVARARRLGAGSVALPVPDADVSARPISERIEGLLSGAIAALAEDSADVRLSLVTPTAEAARSRKTLAALLPRLRAAAGAVQVQVVDLRETGRIRRSPQGVPGSSPQPRPGIK